MELVTIKILDRRARKLLADLQSQRLIDITDQKQEGIAFKKLLSRLRYKSNEAPSPEEIQKQVRAIRKRRYEK